MQACRKITQVLYQTKPKHAVQIFSFLNITEVFYEILDEKKSAERIRQMKGTVTHATEIRPWSGGLGPKLLVANSFFRLIITAMVRTVC
jgi:hypothetical protein